MGVVWKLVEAPSCFFYVSISLKRILFNVVRHGMDSIMEVSQPCLCTLIICMFMTKKFYDENMKKITFKSHGLSTWVGS